MERRRVCCFCEIWENGGIEAFLAGILTQMDLTSLQVDIVATQLEENSLTESLRQRGVRFVPLSGNTRNLPKNARMFRKIIRDRQYDVLHLNLYQGLSLFYARIARQEGIPIRIAHSHNSDLRPSPGRSLKLLLHRMGRLFFEPDVTHRWACSHPAGEFLFAKPFRMIPNGIQTEDFAFDPTVRQKIRRNLDVRDQILLGNAGRLCTQKNQRFLLDVLARLPKNYVLALAGEGEDRQMLEKRIEQLGLRDRVMLLGHCRQVPALMQGMDLYLLPSLFEGFPLSAIEAQAAGLPILCADTLSREINITDRVEFLPLEAALWAQRIQEIPLTRQKDAQGVLARAGFSRQAVAKEIENTYREVIG